MANPKVLSPGPSAPAYSEKTADGSEAPRKDMPMSTHMKQIMACVAYGACSICITLFNKAVFAVYKFQFPNIVTLLQILVSIVYIRMLVATGHMKLAPFSWKIAKQLAPMTFFWWVYVVGGVTALRYLNVPMFSVLRRSTSMVVVFINFCLQGSKTLPTKASMGALVTMVAGAVVAGVSDLTYNRTGYIWTFICIFATAAYLISIKWSKEKTGVTEQDLLMYNNLIALPIMLIYLVVGTSELKTVMEYPRLYDLDFQLFLLVSVSQAFLLNVCIFYCTTTNSPLATTVTGQLKDFIMTGLGMFLFGDVIFNAVNISGLCIGLGGGLWYSYVGYKNAQEKAKANKDSSV